MIPNDVLSEMVRLLEAGEGFALATLVDTHGSTPQKEGARLIVRADGGTAGTLGGGCIEAEAWEAAREVLRVGTPRVLDFELTEDIAVDYGLACGGREKMLVVPVRTDGETASFVRTLRDAMRAGRRGMLVTVVRAGDGVAAGASAAVWGDGAIDGMVGALQDEAVTLARKALDEAHPRARLVRTRSGAELFVEPIAPPTEVIVVGGGHVGRAVATAAKFAGYRVAVIDDREDFANRERFPDADEVVVDEVDHALEAYAVNRSSAIVIVTRGHKYDYQALSAAAKSDAFYVGLMGSRRKVALIYRQLLEEGVPAERLRAVHAPIGLDIGAVTPEEIAVSIIAEVTMCRLGGDGGSMRLDEHILEAQRARAGA